MQHNKPVTKTREPSRYTILYLKYRKENQQEPYFMKEAVKHYETSETLKKIYPNREDLNPETFPELI
jgi:hypothetical protein